MKILPLLFVVALFTGCTRHALLPVQPEGQPLDAKRWQIRIDAHDGTELALTVWQPALAGDQEAPLLLHSHGVGLSRMKRSVGLYANVLFTGRTARKMWKEGYWLITWDQRGHGDSGDLIRLMDPEREVRDVSTIIDWAEANLTRLAYRDDSPRIGMIGESYGGAVQYLATVKEPRIDAIVPIATWYDLDLALAPGDVPKGGWLQVLYMITDWYNWRQLPDTLREGFAGVRQGAVPEAAQAFLETHQMQYFCDQGEQPSADALMIQGLRDVLFHSGQALAARECFQDAGRDTNLIVVRDGHLLPMHQFSTQVPGWALDTRLHCFDEPQRTYDVVSAWLETRLRDHPPQVLPPVCVSPKHWGVALNDWPGGGERIELDAIRLSGDRSRQRSLMSTPSRWLNPVRSEASLAERYSGGIDSSRHPAFIPLHTAEQEEMRVGTPILTLASEHDGPVFAALVSRRPGSGRLRRVHQQETPVHPGEATSLPPLALQLQAGEQLGLTLYSRSAQYSKNRLDFGEGVVISGELLLPEALSASRETPLVLP